MTKNEFSAIQKLAGKNLCVAAICHANKKGDVSESQQRYYSALVRKYPTWSFVGCYADKKLADETEDVAGDIQQLLTDCYAGKIDLIFTKSRYVFKSNIQECISFIRTLREMNPPVGLYMDDVDFYSLRPDADLLLLCCSVTAEIESANKRRLASGVNFENINTLKAARAGRGFTQQQVADKAGLGIRHYQMLERGERDIKTATFCIAMAICKALEIAPESLLAYQ